MNRRRFPGEQKTRQLSNHNKATANYDDAVNACSSSVHLNMPKTTSMGSTYGMQVIVYFLSLKYLSKKNSAGEINQNPTRMQYSVTNGRKNKLTRKIIFYTHARTHNRLTALCLGLPR